MRKEYWTCSCDPKTDACHRSYKQNNDFFLRKETLARIQGSGPQSQGDIDLLLECIESELLELRAQGWLASQPGADANCYVFPTQQGWLGKIQALSELTTRISTDGIELTLCAELAGRALYTMSWGHPGHEGLPGFT